MKILVIDNLNMPFLENKSTGGIETLVNIQLDLLSDSHDVVFYTSADSHSRDKTHTIKSQNISKMNSYDSSLARNIITNKEIKQVAISHQVDFIINHCQSNNSIVKNLTALGIPSITYAHNTHEVIGGIAGLAYVEELALYYQSGGLVVNMSKTSLCKWIAYAEKVKKKVCNPFTTYHHAFAIKNAPIVPKDIVNRGVMATRITKSKNIKSIITAHESNNKQLTIFYIAPRKEDEREYFSEIQNSINNTVMIEGASRETIDEEISKSAYLVISSPESFGLASIEAALRGVPTLLVYSSDYHPVKELVDITGITETVIHRTPKEFKNNMNFGVLDYETRLSISNKTYEYFCFEAAKIRLEEIIAKAIQHNKAILRNASFEV